VKIGLTIRNFKQPCYHNRTKHPSYVLKRLFSKGKLKNWRTCP